MKNMNTDMNREPKGENIAGVSYVLLTNKATAGIAERLRCISSI